LLADYHPLLGKLFGTSVDPTDARNAKKQIAVGVSDRQV